MLSLRRVLIVLLLCTGLHASAQTPVILRVTRAEQHDTLGCNFVSELTRIAYTAIMNGKAKLWDSPAKEIQLMPQSLKEIEKSSGTSFEDQEVIFIYEFWENSGHNLRSTTTGFLFSNKSTNGEDVAYGYVEYNDLQETFMREQLVTNANGNFNTNLTTLIYNKTYNYKILQFAGNVVSSATESQKIKESYIGEQKFNLTAFSRNEVPQKMVVWNVDLFSTTNAEKSKGSKTFVTALEVFLRQNEEIFMNLGGDQVLESTGGKSWKITKIQVSELWKKVNDSLMFDPVAITIFVNDSALAELPYREMVKYDIRVGEANWIDFIRSKAYAFVITKINGQSINRQQAYQYQKALYTYDWHKLTEYVKYY